MNIIFINVQEVLYVRYNLLFSINNLIKNACTFPAMKLTFLEKSLFYKLSEAHHEKKKKKKKPKM